MPKGINLGQSKEFAGSVEMSGIGEDIEIGNLKAYVHSAEEGGYWAEVPALPGCMTQGETLDEVVENLVDAMAGWFSVQTLESLQANSIPYTVSPPLKGKVPALKGMLRTPRTLTLELAL